MNTVLKLRHVGWGPDVALGNVWSFFFFRAEVYSVRFLSADPLALPNF